MAQLSVGIRQLKGQLSHYVDQVKAGSTVLITDRGTPVGQIVPVASTLEDRLQRLAQANLLAWSGRKFGSASPAPVRAQGAKTVAELLLEDRR
jgi:prevent-host-death family protein